MPLSVLVLFTASMNLSVLNLPPGILEIPPDPKEIWIDALADCESSASSTIKVMDTNGKYSRGMFQFQMGTWLSYGKKFGATTQNIYDADLQREVAKSMLDNGGSGHWYNCSKKVSAKLGEYPI